jgi:RimJ/RimL family protein N-acetyltransferase
MQHSLEAEGFGVRLRPVRLDDARFIVWLRNLDHARGMVGDSATDLAQQERWLAHYFERPDDYYFIVETISGLPVGTYGLYDIAGDSAESGRWIIRPEVPAAVPSAVVMCDLAFDRIGLTELRGTAVADNQRVRSFNRKFGSSETRIEPGARIIGGKPVDIVHSVLTKGSWHNVRESLLSLARLAELRIQDWSRTQQTG